MWLPALTMGIGRQKEYLEAMEKLVVEEKRKLRNDAIEECARVVESISWEMASQALAAAAIRALKDKL